ncbi:MAG: hypothetical protein GY716_17360 [bacterium]|nr:hypothetical protein [bacterium]
MSGLLFIWLPGLGAALGLAFAIWLVSLARRDASVLDTEQRIPGREVDVQGTQASAARRPRSININN